MILLLAVVIGLAATLLRAQLKHRTLKLDKLRWEWLVFISVLPQIFFQIPLTGRLIPENFIPYIQIPSMLGLLVFVSANLSVPGFWVLGLGLLTNFFVIAANGGWMPIHQQTLHALVPALPLDHWENGTRLGFTKDLILPAAKTNFILLSDVITLPPWFPYKFAFSLGDIFISTGTVILLWSLSEKEISK